MKAFLAAALVSVFFLAASHLRAEDKPAKAEPLVQLSSASVKGGELTGNSFQTVVELMSRTVAKIVDGKPVTVTENFQVQKTVVVITAYSLDNTEATSRDGKAIAADDLAAKVKAAKIVAIFPTASKPSAEARKKFDADTVFVERIDKK